MTPLMQTYAEAYEQALRAVLEVAEELGPGDWSRPTECPGWTVHDQIAHVVSLEQSLLGDDRPSALGSYGPHVRNKTGELMEDGVDPLRSATPAELLAGLREVVDRRADVLRDGLDPDATTLGPIGTEVPVARFLPIRIFDVWAHEQDVRRAVGRPGDQDGPAARVSREQIAGALPYVVGKVVAPPAGTRVAFDVTGPLTVQQVVEVADDGRAAVADATAPATVTLRMSFDTLARLACGRVTGDAAEVAVEGDAALGARVLAAMAITP